MQLVKLCYIAHGWSLALRDKALFANRIEAWQYGPVIPDLYQVTKPWGRKPIALEAIGTTAAPTGLTQEDCRFLEQVFDGYGHLSGIQLSSMTHRPGTPWSKIYHPPPGTYRLNIIADELIREHYQELAHARR